MALVDIAGVLKFPDWPRGLFDSATTTNSATINSTTDTVAWVVKVLKAGTIDKIHVHLASVTSTHTLRVAFQALNSSGYPDGTDTHYRTISVADTDDHTTKVSGLVTTDGTDVGTKKTVAVGDSFAVVFTVPGYSSGSLSIAYEADGADQYDRATFMFGNNSIPSTSSGVFEGACLGAIEYNDGTFPFFPNLHAYETGTNYPIDDADSPDEYGLKLQIPFKCRARGVFMKCSSRAGTTVNLYSAGGSVIEGPIDLPTETVDSTSQVRIRHLYFTTPVTIEANTDYRIAWKPPASPTTSTLNSFGLASAAQRETLPNGLNMSMTSRTDSGSWTDSTTDMIVAGFIIDQIDDGAGAGGGSCTLINGTAVIPATCPV